MDPLSAVREFRQQHVGATRAVKIAPPPILPVTTSEVPGAEAGVAAPDDTGELDVMHHDGGWSGDDRAQPEDGAAAENRGVVRGRKRVVQVYLPAPTRALLEQARKTHGTLGTAAMAALRGSYQWLVDTCTPAPVEAVGPFPAPRPTRRRLAVEDARMRQLLVDPAEAAGIETLADQLEMSLSELVTLAIDHWFGEGRPAAEAGAARSGGRREPADKARQG